VASWVQELQGRLAAINRYDVPRILAAIAEIGLPEQPHHIDALIGSLERLAGDLQPESPFRPRLEAQLRWLQQERYLHALDIIFDSSEAAAASGNLAFVATRLAQMEAPRLHRAISDHHMGVIRVLVALGGAAGEHGIPNDVLSNAQETLDRCLQGVSRLPVPTPRSPGQYGRASNLHYLHALEIGLGPF
jgi:hypothetical protein